MNETETIFYLIGISVSCVSAVFVVCAAIIFAIDRVWRLWKDTSGFVQLMWAWHLYKNEARKKADENNGQLP